LAARVAFKDTAKLYGGKHDVARLNCLKEDGSSAFLQAKPRDGFSFEQNVVVQTMLAQRFGLSIPVDTQLCDICPSCKKSCDPRGNHYATCPKEQIAALRHNSVVGRLVGSLASGCAPEREWHGDTAGTEHRRPIDIKFNTNDTTGRTAGLDVHIFEATTETDIVNGNVPLAMKKREQRKITELNGSVNRAAIHFVPVVATSYGNIGPRTIQLYKELADGWTLGDRRERDICLRRLKLSLSCAIQVYHAELVLAKCNKMAVLISRGHRPEGSTLFDIPPEYQPVLVEDLTESL